MTRRVALLVLAILSSVQMTLASDERPASAAKRIGILRADTVFDAWVETFRKTLDSLGYAEGRNVTYVHRLKVSKRSFPGSFPFARVWTQVGCYRTGRTSRRYGSRPP